MIQIDYILKFVKRKNTISNKRVKTKVPTARFSGFLFLYVLLGCSTANFGPLLRVQLHSPNVSCCVFVLIMTQSSSRIL